MLQATKIMVIPHAGKPDDATQGVEADGTPGKEFLTVRGWQRAGALARFFARADVVGWRFAWFDLIKRNRTKR